MMRNSLLGRDVRQAVLSPLGLILLAAVCFVMTMSACHAGTGGTEFAAMWTTLQGWVEGTLGRVVTTAMVLVGIGIGVARQSLMAFVVGVGGGLGLYATPGIINNIFVATVATSVAAKAPVVNLAAAVLQLH